MEFRIPSTRSAPAISISLNCPANTATSGGLITYTGTVNNTGNVTLNNVIVIDSQSSPSTVLTVPSLAALIPEPAFGFAPTLTRSGGQNFAHVPVQAIAPCFSSV